MARGVVADNKGDGTEGTLETGNKITLAFGGNQVLPAVAATTFTDVTDF